MIREMHSRDPLSIQQPDDFGFTPIFLAAATKNMELVDLLLTLDVGFSVCNMDNKARWTPLVATFVQQSDIWHIPPPTPDQEQISKLLVDSMVRYGTADCTCGTCADGWLSPKMHNILLSEFG